MSYSPKNSMRKDKIIAVVGPAGSGKSSFIKCATGQDVAISDSLGSCTTKMEDFSYPNPYDDECNIVFIDTPGFDDTPSGGVRGILKKIANWLGGRYGESATLTGLLFFHRITDNRVMNVISTPSLSVLQRLCGAGGLQAVTLVTTMWDDCGEVGPAHETELEEGCWKQMVEEGSRLLRFHDTRESAWTIVGHLLNISPRPEQGSGVGLTPRGSDSFGLGHEQPLSKKLLGQAHKVVPVQVEDLSDERIIIAVMGPTGSGKSTFIGKITGEEVDTGYGLQSSAANIRGVKIESLDRNDCNIVFVDTPGFDDTNKSDMEILDMISSWLKKTYDHRTTLTGLIYLHRISDNRMAGAPLKNLRIFKELCGKNTLQNIVLTTTAWDEVEEGEGEEREKELQSEYWKPMIDQGATTARYRGTADSAWEIVDHFVDAANRRRAVQLQEEIADMKEPLFKTSKGQELYRNLQLLLSEVQEMLKKIRAEAKRRTDGNLLGILKREYEAFRRELATVLEGIRALKCPIGKCLARMV